MRYWPQRPGIRAVAGPAVGYGRSGQRFRPGRPRRRRLGGGPGVGRRGWAVAPGRRYLTLDRSRLRSNPAGSGRSYRNRSTLRWSVPVGPRRPTTATSRRRGRRWRRPRSRRLGVGPGVIRAWTQLLETQSHVAPVLDRDALAAGPGSSHVHRGGLHEHRTRDRGELWMSALGVCLRPILTDSQAFLKRAWPSCDTPRLSAGLSRIR